MSLLVAAAAPPALLPRFPQAPRLQGRPAAYGSSRRSASSRPARSTTRMSVVTTGLKDLEQKLAQLPDASYILFKADWCHDCVRSNVPVKMAVAAAHANLLLVDVADQPNEWKTPTHPLRTDPRFQLEGIPTLVYWKGGQVAAKLGAELEQAPNGGVASEVAAAFVTSNQ